MVPLTLFPHGGPLPVITEGVHRTGVCFSHSFSSDEKGGDHKEDEKLQEKKRMLSDWRNEQERRGTK